MTSENQIIDVIRLVKKESKNFRATALSAAPKNAFQVLVSCIISLRTKDEVTAEASRRLFAVAATPEKIAALDWKTIGKLIKPSNYWKTKAKRIKEIARQISENNNNVPDTMEELLKFKGVGRKTANIVLVYGHNKKYHIPVDTHVHRIPNRLGWINTRKPEETEKELMKLIPKRYWADFNDLFVSFGQNICRPVSPKCGECPLTGKCKYYRTGRRKN